MLNLRFRTPVQSSVAVLPAVLLLSTGGVRAQESLSSPPWRERLMPWVSNAEQPRPWREDSRLEVHFAPGFPDDVVVAFPVRDSTARYPLEMMWVTVTAYDSSTDLFLGILLNEPKFITHLPQWGNVVFVPEGDTGYPTAVAVDGEYGAAGWPMTKAVEYFTTLRDGIRAYRDSRSGHNVPGVERCIEVLEPLMASVPDAARPDEVFVGHFVLGRCYAEKYDTERAIQQFRLAVEIDPDDVDAHMALLAEISVMTHMTSGDEQSHWKRAFVDEYAIVSERFLSDRAVDVLLRAIFGDLSFCPKAQELLERQPVEGHTLPWHYFRWKRR